MRQKYIKGTDKQYSIREDGVIIKNYKRHRVSNTRMDIIFTNNILQVIGNNSVDIIFNNKRRRLSIHKLMHEYFNYAYCMSCNNRFKKGISHLTCNKCRKDNRKKSLLKYYKFNRDSILKNGIKYQKKQTKYLTDNYISQCCKMPANILPGYIIKVKRQQLLLHRTIKQEQNGTNI